MTTPTPRPAAKAMIDAGKEELRAAGREREQQKRACPDGGYCHHDCRTGCFRVLWCGPLSNVFPDDTWPAEVLAANPSTDGKL